MKGNRTQAAGLALLLAIVGIGAALVWRYTSAPLQPETKPLMVAYGDDIAGIVVQKALADLSAQRAELGLDSINLGDCCGSNAQFALSTGQVDVAVLCPDAMTDLAEAGKQYMVLGELVYDGNVLVTRPDSPETYQVIGYMNGREEQRDLLEQVFGEEVDLQPMFASALPYALENRAVDAIMLDVSLAMKLNYPTRSISEGMVTSVMIVRSDLLGDPRLDALRTAFNDTVCAIAGEEELTDMLCAYLETEKKEEVTAFWKTVTVRFGSL
ncbi:MAG: ABC transporter substrate-binding (seleno)protein SaoB [Faecousia sp.]